MSPGTDGSPTSHEVDTGVTPTEAVLTVLDPDSLVGTHVLPGSRPPTPVTWGPSRRIDSRPVRPLPLLSTEERLTLLSDSRQDCRPVICLWSSCRTSSPSPLPFHLTKIISFLSLAIPLPPTHALNVGQSLDLRFFSLPDQSFLFLPPFTERVGSRAFRRQGPLPFLKGCTVAPVAR